MENLLQELVVVKRSGQRISFNKNKIAIAIKQAFDTVYKDNNEEKVNLVYSKVLDYIENNYSDRKTINVEDIQDIIENVLKEQKFTEVYIAFSDYRTKRAASRDIFDRKQQHKFVRATEKLVHAANDDANSNPTELLLNFGKTISNEFSKAYLIDNKYIRNHNEGNIYIHDLDHYVLGTISSSFIDFTNENIDDDFFDNILITIINFKKESYGEHSIPSFDYIVNPYMLYKFKKILNETVKEYFVFEGYENLINFKGIETIVQKINTIYIDLNLFDKYLINEKTKSIFEYVYNLSINKLKNNLKCNIKKLLNILNNYKFGIDNNNYFSISIGTNDTKDGEFINKIYFEVINELNRLDNVCTIYKAKNINNLEYISKLIYLNKNIAISYINASCNKELLKNNDFKYEVEVFSNGDKITNNIFDKNVTSTGRCIISKASINLVRIALNSKNIDDFYNILSNTLELVKNELLQEFEYISNRCKENFEFIFKSNYLLDNEKIDDGQKIKKIIKNGTLSIGYAGLTECTGLLDKNNTNLAIDIVKFMRSKCDEYGNENKLNFSLRETNEKCALKYLKGVDKAIYGVINSVTDKDYYQTFSDYFNNSDSPERFKITSLLQKYSNGGYSEVIKIDKNYSAEKIYEIIINAYNYDVAFLNFEVKL